MESQQSVRLQLVLYLSSQIIEVLTEGVIIQIKLQFYFNCHFHFREEHQDSLTFHIAQSSMKWSTMFGLMETAKQTLEIEDYALGQTSLEQVFLFFTKYQRLTDDS